MMGRPGPLHIPGWLGPLVTLARRLKASPLRELGRIARYGPRLYRASRRVGATRRQAFWTAIVP